MKICSYQLEGLQLAAQKGKPIPGSTLDSGNGAFEFLVPPFERREKLALPVCAIIVKAADRSVVNRLGFFIEIWRQQILAHRKTKVFPLRLAILVFFDDSFLSIPDKSSLHHKKSRTKIACIDLFSSTIGLPADHDIICDVLQQRYSFLVGETEKLKKVCNSGISGESIEMMGASLVNEFEQLFSVIISVLKD